MTREQTIEILSAFNAWRRYDGPIGEGPVMPGPKEIGMAIDSAIAILQSKEVAGMESIWNYSPKQLIEINLTQHPDLSIRVRERLKWVNIFNMNDLIHHRRRDLIRIRGFGAKSMREIDDLLKKYHLTFIEDQHTIEE